MFSFCISPTRKATWMVALAVAAAVRSTAAPNFPTGTFIVTGSLKNWKNALYTSDDNVSVQAVSSGHILAECDVQTALERSDGRNFSLSISLSTVATDKTAKVGDTVNLVVLDGAMVHIASEAIRISGADRWTNINAQVVSVQTFPSTSEYAAGGEVSVARAYLEEIQPWLDFCGYDAYAPDADWDGDGMSNYAEYLAGTNPFDTSERLRITDFRLVDGDRAALSFEYSGGHVYSLLASPSLAHPEWATEKFAADEKATEATLETVTFSGSDEDADIATVYVMPVSPNPARFFKVEAK